MQVTIKKLIIYLIYFSVLLDSINGFLIYEFSLSVTPIYRTILLSLMLYFLTKRRILTPLLITVALLIINFIHVIIYQDTSGLNLGITWSLKYVIIIVSFYFFKLYLKEDPRAFDDIKRIFIISFIVLFFNLAGGYLGLGYETYAREGLGNKGFFKAGNEVALLLINIAFGFLIYLLHKKRIYIFLTFATTFLILSLILATKTGILGSIILITFLPIINTVISRKRSKSLFLLIIIFLVTIFSGSSIIDYSLKSMNLSGKYGRYFESHNEDSIDKIYGGREEWINSVMEYIGENGDVKSYFFGFSYTKMVDVIEKSTENDFVDIFFIFGSLGILLTYGFFLLRLYTHSLIFLKNKMSSPNSIYSIFYIILLLFISITSGHVIMSSLSGILIGLNLSIFDNYSLFNKRRL